MKFKNLHAKHIKQKDFFFSISPFILFLGWSKKEETVESSEKGELDSLKY